MLHQSIINVIANFTVAQIGRSQIIGDISRHYSAGTVLNTHTNENMVLWALYENAIYSIILPVFLPRDH